MMSDPGKMVFLIDDEESVRYGISLLLSSAGYIVECFSNAEDFLEKDNVSMAGCIVLDIFLDGKTGLDLQEQIRSKFDHLPIIYMTGYGNVPMSVQALKKGAINFLQKPVDDLELINAVEEAVYQSSSVLAEKTQLARINSLISSLTSRETEIFRCIIKGMLNKQIAAELGIVEQTVKLHRGKITTKLQVKSVAEMVRMAEMVRFR